MKTRMTVPAVAVILMIAAILVYADNLGEKKAMPAGRTAAIGEMAPDFTLTDATGETHSLSDFKGKYVVLEWINFGCPFVQKHYKSGNMQALQTKYREKGIVWLAICSSAPGKQGYYSGKGLTSAIEDHKVKANAYLIDDDGTVGRMYNAKTTPNMYIINPDGFLIYAGAIDDRPTVKEQDIDGATNYVMKALDQAMAGEEITVKATQPYGCSVKYANK